MKKERKHFQSLIKAAVAALASQPPPPVWQQPAKSTIVNIHNESVLFFSLCGILTAWEHFETKVKLFFVRELNVQCAVCVLPLLLLHHLSSNIMTMT